MENDSITREQLDAVERFAKSVKRKLRLFLYGLALEDMNVSICARIDSVLERYRRRWEDEVKVQKEYHAKV